LRRLKNDYSRPFGVFFGKNWEMKTFAMQLPGITILPIKRRKNQFSGFVSGREQKLGSQKRKLKTTPK